MKALVFGTGIEFSHILALAEAGVEVYYYTDFISTFPSFDDFATGYGFPNIKKVHDPFTYIDKVDLIANFDVLNGDLFEYLKKKGYKIFGGGVATELELNRRALKSALSVVKLDTPPYKIVKGYDNIPIPSVVKLSIFRGSMETFVLKNETQKKNLKTKLEIEFGAFLKDMEFVVEDLLDLDKNYVEAGIDAFFDADKGGFIFPLLLGIEYRKGVYIGKVINHLGELPKPLQETVLKLSQLLIKTGYRGMLSTEEFINIKTGKHYFLDITVRGAYPLSLGYRYLIENFKDVVFNSASPKYRGKYYVAVPFSIKETENMFVNVKFPEKDKRFNFEALMKVRNEYYVPKAEQPAEGVVCEVFDKLDLSKIKNTMADLLGKIEAYSLTDELEQLEDCYNEFIKLNK
ncbi:MAG: hypothetical protein JHC31_04685 [Sulfurihydrogenibium sp.]|jgi:hypothetical protein|nr:hypothetical protein [Sulfurihydrogenibium sp.]